MTGAAAIRNARAGASERRAQALRQSWPEEHGHPRRWAIMVVLGAVAFMAQLDLFIVNIAIPAMSRSFGGSSLSGLSWVLNGYAIVFAALLVPAGRLADHYGRRRFLLAGVLLFTSSSALCAIAPTLEVVIAGRVLQAVGAAMIVPTSLGLLLPVFAKRHHSLAVGIWAGVAAVAASSGAPLGGLLVTLSWRWIFLVNVPIGLATVLLGSRVLPEIQAQATSRLPSATSISTLLVPVTLLVLGTVQGPSWGWSSPAVIALLAGAAVGGGLVVAQTLRSSRPLLEPALFASREFSSAAVALFLFYLSFAVFLLITVLFLQDQWHYSPLRAGIAIVPGPAMSALLALNTGRVTARIGRTVAAATGTLLVAAAASYWLVLAPAHGDYLGGFLPGMLLGGVGSGLAQAPLFAAASTLPQEHASTGSAVLNMARQLGSAVGIAVLVALLGTQHPESLALFQRGWLLQAAVAVAAGGAIVLPRLRATSSLVVGTRGLRGGGRGECAANLSGRGA